MLKVLHVYTTVTVLPFSDAMMAQNMSRKPFQIFLFSLKQIPEDQKKNNLSGGVLFTDVYFPPHRRFIESSQLQPCAILAKQVANTQVIYIQISVNLIQ